MNKVDSIKEIIKSDDFQEKNREIFDCLLGAISGSKINALKLFDYLRKYPAFINQTVFWMKLSKFFDGVFIDEDSRLKMASKLAQEGEKDDNAMRLVVCIDKADSMKKICFMINATRCFLAEYINREEFFRICFAITNTILEDLLFLRDNIEKENLHCNQNVFGLFSSGLMYVSVFGRNPAYSFTELADLVDQYAVSFDDVDQYPDPKKRKIRSIVNKLDMNVLTFENVEK